MAVGDQYFVKAGGAVGGGAAPATTTDGRDPIGFALATATYDLTGNGEGESHLSSAGAFTSYTWVSGDQIYLSGGAGITPDLYTIASRVDNDAILLVGAAGTDSTSDVTSSSGPWGDATDETTGLQHAIDTMTGNGNVLNICADANYVLTSTIDLDIATGTVLLPLVYRGTKSNGEWDGATRPLIDASGLATTNDAFKQQTTFPYIRWMDLHITGDPAFTTKSAATNAGIYSKGMDAQFERVRISWFGGYGYEGATSTSLLIAIDCEFDHNNYGAYADSANFRYISGIRSLFHHNTLVGCGVLPKNSRSGFFQECQFFRNGSDGMLTTNSTQTVILNACLFDNNTSDGVARSSSYAPMVVSNCTFTNNGAYGITGGDGANVSLRACAFNSNTSGDVNWTPVGALPLDSFSDNVTAAPAYVAVTDEAADYHPDTGSPLLNAGHELA